MIFVGCCYEIGNSLIFKLVFGKLNVSLNFIKIVS